MGAMGPGGRYGPMLRPTRRRLIGGAVLLGGGALLAACGATATPTTSPAFAVTPAAAATVTGVIGVPVTRTLAATPAINDGSATELGRLLELIPQMESLPGRNGLWFADVARQKRNYGYEQITSLEAALLRQGYATVPYQDRTYLSRLGDGEVKLSDPIVRLVLSRLNRVATEDGALVSAPFTAAIEAGMDAADGRRPTFAANPDYAALALALGPVVGAILTLLDELYRPARPPSRAATPVATRTAVPARARLHPYRLVGLGLRDDGATHTMLVALVYASAAEARAAAPILRQRVEDYMLIRSGQRLSERARPGEPEIVVAGARTVLVQPFAITTEANLSLYLQMYTSRDLLFLAE